MNPFGVYQEHVFVVRPGGAHPHSFKLRWDRGAGAVDIDEPVNHTKAKVHASYWHDVHHLGPDGQPLLAWNPISGYARRAEEVEWAEGEAGAAAERGEAHVLIRAADCRHPYRGAGRVQDGALRPRELRRAGGLVHGQLRATAEPTAAVAAEPAAAAAQPAAVAAAARRAALLCRWT